jgi:hypothetical protein
MMRMMSYRPTNRYQSAKEVLQALRSVADLVGGNSNNLEAEPALSMPAMSGPTPTYGNYGPSSSGSSSQNRYTTYSPKQKSRNPILNSPWVLAAAGGLLVLVPVSLMTLLLPKNSSITKTDPTPVVTPSPIVQPSGQQSSPAPSATASNSLSTPEALPPETLNIPTGQTALREGTLRDNQTMVYRLPGLSQGNQLTAKIDGGTVQLSVLAPNSEPVNFQSKKVSQWQGSIPVSGDYLVELSLPSGTAPSNYKLTIINVAQAPIVSPSGSSVPSPTLPVGGNSSPLVSPTFSITPPPVTSPR